jgi:hypothetical protein
MTDHTGPDGPLVSIVVLNYNYGRYLPQCLDSALAQDYAPLEVIVVDDGSTDDSRAVIDTYGSRIIPSFKENGGMVTSMNHGFRLSRGSIVIFIDADDYLLPGAVADHVRALSEPGVVRSQTYLTVVSDGQLALSRIPGVPADEGDLRERVLKMGPGAYVSSPNSGNAWSRRYLEQVFPLPETLRGLGSDSFLMDSSPLFGRVVTLKPEPRAVYRSHRSGQNAKRSGMTIENIRTVIAYQELRATWLETVATSRGYKASMADWRARNWRWLTLDCLARRLSGVAEHVSLTDYLRPALLVQGNPIKGPILALMLFGIRVAPLNVARAVAGRLINLRYM